MISANCKGCTKRYIGCHSTCEIYKAYRAKIDEANQARHTEALNQDFCMSLKRKIVKRQEHKGIRADGGKLR